MIKHLISIIIYCIVLIPSVSAAASYNVVPRTIDREMLARDIRTESIVITNNEAYRVNVYAAVYKLVVDDDGNILEYLSAREVGNDSSITSWLEITQGVLTLEPGASTTAKLRIAVPQNTVPGVYHALIGFGSGRNRPIAESQIVSGGAPGTILRIEVPEVTVQQSDLDAFSVDRLVLDQSQSAVMYTITNTTNKPITPQGEVIIYNGRGAEIGTVEINTAGEVVPAGESLVFESAIDTLGLLGRYQAALVLDNDNLGAAVFDARIFYYLPWWQVLLLLMVLFGSSAVLYRRLHASEQRPVEGSYDGVLPVHVYEGESVAVDHDINLKQQK